MEEDYGLSLIHQAALKGDISLVLQEIWRDPSLLELQNDEGLSPLANATRSCKLPIIKKLVKMGANINSQDNLGRTPLSLAAYQGWHEGVVYLLRHGARQHIVDKSGRTPLHASTYDQNLSTLTVLLQTLGEEDINRPDNELMTALHWAAFHNRPEHLDQLIDRGADPLAQDVDGKTPLHWAAQNGCTDCCKKIASCREGPQLINSVDFSGKTPVHFAAAAGHDDIIKALNSFSGCDLEPVDPDDRTPLHWAAAMGKMNCMKLLLSLDVNSNPVDCEGGTPLDYTRQSGHKDCQLMLEQKLGLDSNRDEVETTTQEHIRDSTTKTKRGPLRFIRDLFVTRKASSDIGLTDSHSFQLKQNDGLNIHCITRVEYSSSQSDSKLPSVLIPSVKPTLQTRSSLNKIPNKYILDNISPRSLSTKPLPDINSSSSPTNTCSNLSHDMDVRVPTPKLSDRKDKLAPLKGVKPLQVKGLLSHGRISALKKEESGPRSPTPPADFDNRFSHFTDRRHSFHTDKMRTDSPLISVKNNVRNCTSSCGESNLLIKKGTSRRISTRSHQDQVLRKDSNSSEEEILGNNIEEFENKGLTLPERTTLNRKIQSVLY